MSISVLGTEDTKSFTVSGEVKVNLSNSDQSSSMNIGEFIVKSCIKDLLNSDVAVEGNKQYSIKLLVCIQDITDDTVNTDRD